MLPNKVYVIANRGCQSHKDHLFGITFSKNSAYMLYHQIPKYFVDDNDYLMEIYEIKTSLDKAFFRNGVEIPIETDYIDENIDKVCVYIYKNEEDNEFDYVAIDISKTSDIMTNTLFLDQILNDVD